MRSRDFKPSALVLIFALILSSSCSDNVQLGCTDEQAINFSIDAEDDDGSCQYLSDPFIGRYSGIGTCELLGLNNTRFQFQISKMETDPNTVNTTFEFPIGIIQWPGIVEGDKILYDAIRPVLSHTFDWLCGIHGNSTLIQFKGSALLTSGILSMNNIQLKVFDDAGGDFACSTVCTLSGTKD